MEIDSATTHEMQNRDEVEINSCPPPPQPFPWLIFFSRGDIEDKQTFYSLIEEKCYERNISHMVVSQCMALTNGWMLMAEENNGRCSLVNLARFKVIDLPAPRQSFFESMISGVLTAPPSNPKSTLIFISSRSPHLIYNNVGGNKRWVSKKYPIEDDDEYYGMLLESMVICRGKIYAMSKAGLFTVKIMKKRIAVRSAIPSFPCKVSGMGILSKLVECSRDLFLVVQIYFGRTKEVKSFDVYKMDSGKSAWKKVNNLGEQAFFFSTNNLGCASCFSVGGPKVKANSIYYVNKKYDGIFRYDMGERSISMDHLPLEEAYGSNVQVGWVKTM